MLDEVGFLAEWFIADVTAEGLLARMRSQMDFDVALVEEAATAYAAPVNGLLLAEDANAVEDHLAVFLVAAVAGLFAGEVGRCRVGEIGRDHAVEGVARDEHVGGGDFECASVWGIVAIAVLNEPAVEEEVFRG